MFVLFRYFEEPLNDFLLLALVSLLMPIDIHVRLVFLTHLNKNTSNLIHLTIDSIAQIVLLHPNKLVRYLLYQRHFSHFCLLDFASKIKHHSRQELL
nr:MAG TPA: hypothetical protein [Caudoviricetes sp.]